jgi:hypothetical protein
MVAISREGKQDLSRSHLATHHNSTPNSPACTAFATRSSQPNSHLPDIANMSRTAKEKALAVVKDGEALVRASKLPPFVRFPLLVILSLTFSSLLYNLSAPYTGLELAGVSRRLECWEEVLGLVGWRV